MHSGHHSMLTISWNTTHKCNLVGQPRLKRSSGNNSRLCYSGSVHCRVEKGAALHKCNCAFIETYLTVTMKRPSPAFYWIALILILLGFGVRIVDVMKIPFFSDEAWHLIRSHFILQGQTFAGMDQNKWLYGYIVSWFNPTGPEGPWIARYINILWAVISLSACIGLGRLLDKPLTGLLAGLIYSVVPLTVFHERQALTDPQVTAFAALSMIFMVKLAKTRRWQWGALLIAALILGRATKPTILPFMLLPLVATALWMLPANHFTLKPLFEDKFANWKRMTVPLVFSVLSIIAVLAFGEGLIAVASASGISPRDQVSVESTNTIISLIGTPELIPRLQDDLTVLIDAALRYAGLVAVLGVVMALIWAAARREKWREVLFLLGPAVVFVSMVIIAERPTSTGEIATRYLLINMVAFSVLSALGLRITAERIGQANIQLEPIFLGGSILAILIPSLIWDVGMITDPVNLAWNKYDRRVYFEDTTSGYYHMGAVDWLLDEWRHNDGDRQHTVGGPKTMLWVQSYLGPRVGEFKSIIFDSPEQTYQIALWLNSGDDVFLIESPEERRFEPGPNGTELEYLTEWESLFGPQRLYRVVGAREELATDIYDLLGDDPEFMQQDYSAVGASLEANGIAKVLIYPYDHAPILSQYTGAEVLAVPGNTWPLTAQSVEEGIASLDLNEGSIFAVVTYDPPSTDPSRLVSSTLHTEAYRIGQAEWFGLLNVQYFVAGPTEPTLQPVNAVFEGVISLNNATVLDESPAPGDTIRMAFDWSSETAVEDNFFIFTHILDADSNLVAQHDGEPSGSLRPFTTWEPDEIITDRYAIRLAADLAPGSYRVLTGIYNPASGLRLRVTEGSDLPDAVLITTIEVADQRR